MRHVFGPVPSRRLGFSLGVDVVPYKTCSLDCIYCQAGRTTNKTIEREEYTSCDDILAEIEEVLAKQKREIEYITLSGSGEPTLNRRLKRIINGIRKLVPIPIAVITNGTLLFQPEVREELMEADLVLPSLDAASEEAFKKVNRPHHSLRINKIIDGLGDLSREFRGEIWLEVMIARGMNNHSEEMERIAESIEKIKPDKIQLNTVVRPPAEELAQPVGSQDLRKLKRILGEKCEIIAGFKRPKQEFQGENTQKRILALAERRSVTLLDISYSLGIPQDKAIEHLNILKKKDQVLTRVHRGERYYCARDGV